MTRSGAGVCKMCGVILGIGFLGGCCGKKLVATSLGCVLEALELDREVSVRHVDHGENITFLSD